MNTARERLDWRGMRNQIDVAALAEVLLGPPQKREGGRLVWLCPFHDEKTPSFKIEPGRPTFKCWGCGERGDGADFVGKVEHLEFPASARRAAEILGMMIPEGDSRPPKPRPKPVPPPPEPSGLPASEALRLVEEAEARLWTDAGVMALEYLRGARGLDDRTIRAARLGWTPGVTAPNRNGQGYRASGITIPWFDGDRLAMVKVRQRSHAKPKYCEVYRDLPTSFPNLASVRAGFPLVVAEGEFDTLLLGQEIGDLAAVVTVGSASTALTPQLIRALLPATPWYVAVDGDAAGDRFAAGWPARARRVRPFGGCKDWTDLHATGRSRIRHWWVPMLEGRANAADLEAKRWGPALLNPAVLDAVGPPPIDPAWLSDFNASLGRPDPDDLNRLSAEGDARVA